MLYRLIIADDEPIVCKLLTQNIKWNEIGFEIIATFSDGEEVINFLSENSCDVILCDIKMIKISGIELAEFVYNNRPEIKVILFSGYRDFENAVSALKYNVENYLLKPLKVTELVEIFKVLKNKLDNEKSDFLYKKYMLREILTNFKNGIFNSEDKLQKQLTPFNLASIADSSVASFKIRLDNPYECAEENILANTFQNLVDKNIENASAYFLQGSSSCAEYIIISEIDNKMFFEEYADKIAKNIMEFTKIKASIEDFIYYSKGRELINSSSVNSKFDKQKLELFENQLINSVNSNNKDDILAILDAIFVRISENDAHSLINFIEKLIETVIFKLKKENIELSHFINYLRTVESIDKIKNLTKEYFVDLSNQSEMQSDLSRKSTILWARTYIEEHCCEDLTLEKVASIVYLAPTYFSKLFKSITGQNYIDFLIGCRMNLAKKLLITTNLKVSEIGNRVGYANASFFNRLFKVNCGITPTEYRIKYAKGRN